MIGEIYIHGVLLVGMAFLYITTYTFPRLDIGGAMGAAGWPQFILILSMILTIMSAVSVIKKGKIAANIKKTESKEGHTGKEMELRFFTAVGAFLGFIIILPYLGFLFSFPLVLGFFIWYLGIRKPLPLLANTIIITLVFAYLFGALLYVVLPRGMGIFRTLSFFIY